MAMTPYEFDVDAETEQVLDLALEMTHTALDRAVHGDLICRECPWACSGSRPNAANVQAK
jgi:hypothetical protein